MMNRSFRPPWAMLMGFCMLALRQDFAFDMQDWPFEELDDLLRVSEEDS